jgi:hypothetical protein
MKEMYHPGELGEQRKMILKWILCRVWSYELNSTDLRSVQALVPVNTLLNFLLPQDGRNCFTAIMLLTSYEELCSVELLQVIKWRKRKKSIFILPFHGSNWWIMRVQFINFLCMSIKKVPRPIIRHVCMKQTVPILMEEYLLYWSRWKLPSESWTERKHSYRLIINQ